MPKGGKSPWFSKFGCWPIIIELSVIFNHTNIKHYFQVKKENIQKMEELAKKRKSQSWTQKCWPCWNWCSMSTSTPVRRWGQGWAWRQGWGWRWSTCGSAWGRWWGYMLYNDNFSVQEEGQEKEEVFNSGIKQYS